MLKSFRMFETQEEWDAEVAKTEAGLRKNLNDPNADLAEHGARIIKARFAENSTHYLEFGVYWFAVKQVIQKYYPDAFGDYFNEEMVQEYSGKTDAHTLVAAEKFKEMYRQTYFQGNRYFTLEEDDDREYCLSDPYFRQMEDAEKWFYGINDDFDDEEDEE